MVKPSVVYLNTISLIALMLHSLQIIVQFRKCVSLFERTKAQKDDTERIVMDTFKGYDNAEIKELFSKMSLSW